MIEVVGLGGGAFMFDVLVIAVIVSRSACCPVSVNCQCAVGRVGAVPYRSEPDALGNTGD